jgi:hypothetical protein
MFSNEDNAQNIDNSFTNTNYFQRRHLNEFGQILSTGTRSPEETDAVYGKVVTAEFYNSDDINQTESINSVRLLKEIGLQQDGPTFATKSTSKPFIVSNPGFEPKFGDIDNEEIDDNVYSKIDPKHQPPGTFGSPYTSIGPKQVK